MKFQNFYVVKFRDDLYLSHDESLVNSADYAEWFYDVATASYFGNIKMNKNLNLPQYQIYTIEVRSIILGERILK